MRHSTRSTLQSKRLPNVGLVLEVKEEVVNEVKRYYGFFVLISNETMNSIEALEIYRNKDVVEKAFGNLKERLNMRRLLVSSERNLDGKLFIEFIALIYLSYIKKQMQTQEMYKHYTLQGMLDKLDVIECYQSTGKKLRVGEVLEKAKRDLSSAGCGSAFLVMSFGNGRLYCARGV